MAARTTTVVVSELFFSPSSAQSCSTYVPGAVKCAVVTTASGVPNSTAEGPLTWLHRTLSVPPAGWPSSLTVPASVRVSTGRAISRSGPASTTGGSLATAETVICTSSLASSSVSVARRRRTYTPAALKVAPVAAAFGSSKVTVPGPVTFSHSISITPEGRPSSATLPAREAVPGGRAIVWSAPASTDGGWL